MNLIEKPKKFIASTLAGVMIFLSANSFSVHAQSATSVSIDRPILGFVRTDDGSGLNVRNAPNLTSSQIITAIPDDTFLMVVEEIGDFCKVQYDTAGHYGYVWRLYLTIYRASYYLQANTNSSDLNMRESNSTSSKILTSIPKGKYFAYRNEVTDWYYGVYGNKIGYTSKAYTKRYDFNW